MKTALITGGSSGIGLAIAKKFIDRGFRVVITGRNGIKLAEVSQLLGKSCIAKQFDMNWMDKIPGFVAEIVSETGSIDVLVNNAGINQKKPFLETTDEDFQNIILTNQTALFSLSREVARKMVQQASKGNIINISSMAAQYGIPKIISYTASKTALDGMTRAMAVELSPLGIRVNSVAPGFIKTPMSSRALDDDPERRTKVISRTPMQKLGDPEDVANAVFFLASDEAAFITGVVLRVDGGNAIGF